VSEPAIGLEAATYKAALSIEGCKEADGVVLPIAVIRALIAAANALSESVKLQSHYAELLNGWDDGHRLQFADAQAWLDRLSQLAGRRP